MSALLLGVTDQDTGPDGSAPGLEGGLVFGVSAGLGHTRDCRRNGSGPVAGHAGFVTSFATITGDVRPVRCSAGDHACRGPIESPPSGYGGSWLGAHSPGANPGIEVSVNPDSHPWADATDGASEAR
jgi:hypothetical protein